MSRILNFGSLNLDHVYQVPHFLRPGETLSSTQYACHLGGKGLNQSIALQRAGAQVFHAGRVGRDGQPLTDALRSAGVDTGHVAVGEEKTGHTIIQVDQTGQNCILLYGGANQALRQEDILATLRQFQPGDVLVLQNEINRLDEVLRLAKELGLRIVLNPSPMTKELLAAPLHCVDLFVLNELEGEAMTGIQEPDGIGAALLAQYPQAQVLLTLGEKGALYFAKGIRLAQSAFQVPVVDTTAAGDTFLGYFVARTTLGDSAQQALELASTAAALAVGQAGAAQSIPGLAQVRQAQGQLRPWHGTSGSSNNNEEA